MNWANNSSSTVQRFDYLSLANNFSNCRCEASFKSTCVDVVGKLGYDYYFFCNYFPTLDRVLISSNFPSEWLDRYKSLGYAAIDPTARHCLTDSCFIDWRNIVYSCGTAGLSERNFINEAKSFGLNTGLSIPIHGVGAETGMLSLASSQIRGSAEEFDGLGLQAIAQSMNLSMKEVFQVPIKNLSTKLSSREDECMAWTAKGKTSWEIARILDISKNTVIFHLRNSIKKLEATNRTQAVAKAISLHGFRPYL